MSAIGAVGSTPHTYTPQPVQSAPVKSRDSDGDHDNDATESAGARAQESGKVNVLA